MDTKQRELSQKLSSKYSTEDQVMDTSEIEEILKVLRRNDKLHQDNSEKVDALREEITQMECDIVDTTKKSWKNVCIYCKKRLFWFISKLFECPRCDRHSCQKCVVKSDADSWLCILCHKKMEMKKLSGDWLRSSFRIDKRSLKSFVKKTLKKYEVIDLNTEKTAEIENDLHQNTDEVIKTDCVSNLPDCVVSTTISRGTPSLAVSRRNCQLELENIKKKEYIQDSKIINDHLPINQKEKCEELISKQSDESSKFQKDLDLKVDKYYSSKIILEKEDSFDELIKNCSAHEIRSPSIIEVYNCNLEYVAPDLPDLLEHENKKLTKKCAIIKQNNIESEMELPITEEKCSDEKLGFRISQPLPDNDVNMTCNILLQDPPTTLSEEPSKPKVDFQSIKEKLRRIEKSYSRRSSVSSRDNKSADKTRSFSVDISNTEPVLSTREIFQKCINLRKQTTEVKEKHIISESKVQEVESNLDIDAKLNESPIKENPGAQLSCASPEQQIESNEKTTSEVNNSSIKKEDQTESEICDSRSDCELNADQNDIITDKSGEEQVSETESKDDEDTSNTAVISKNECTVSSETIKENELNTELVVCENITPDSEPEKIENNETEKETSIVEVSLDEKQRANKDHVNENNEMEHEENTSKEIENNGETADIRSSGDESDNNELSFNYFQSMRRSHLTKPTEQRKKLLSARNRLITKNAPENNDDKVEETLADRISLDSSSASTILPDIGEKPLFIPSSCKEVNIDTAIEVDELRKNLSGI